LSGCIDVHDFWEKLNKHVEVLYNDDQYTILAEKGISIHAVNPSLVLVAGSTVASQTLSVLSNGNVMIDGISLAPNAPALTIAETPILLGDDGLVVGTSTTPLPSLTAAAVAAIVTVPGKSVTVLPNGDVVIAGTTVTPNAPIIAVAGTPVSLGSSGLVNKDVHSTIVLSTINPDCHNRRQDIRSTTDHKWSRYSGYVAPNRSECDYLQDSCQAWEYGDDWNVNRTPSKYWTLASTGYWWLHTFWYQRRSDCAICDWLCEFEPVSNEWYWGRWWYRSVFGRFKQGEGPSQRL